MDLLRAKIQHLERVASEAKTKAEREQDDAKLATCEAAMHKVCGPAAHPSKEFLADPP